MKSHKNLKPLIGYTTGVFDLFHVGHMNILRNAKSLCNKLIVGVSTDKLVKMKLKKSIIPFNERIQIVQSCKYVDVALPQTSVNKLTEWKKLKFDILFVGDDWYKDKKWTHYENEFKTHKVRVVYFPYTKGTSSTLINKTLKDLRKKTK